ncbi:MAG: biopolymer transporter ExbD [Pseudomonadota bacterium]
MTSLIDVIFLLLLFFMLSSTFSKFAEVQLSAAGAGQVNAVAQVPPVFLRVGQEALSVNGDVLALDALAEVLVADSRVETARPLLISLQSGVTAQRLTDVLVVLRGVPGVHVTVLGGA